MGLFDKKYCDICGEKIGLLGNRKLEDGNLCKECAKKLSPWFNERRSSTVQQIREQLDWREKNRERAALFCATRSFGEGTKLLLDETHRWFTVTRAADLAGENPDVLEFSAITGCRTDIDSRRTELKIETRDREGKIIRKSYSPPRYEYDYDFHIVISVNLPFFNEMKFQLNDRALHVPYRPTGSILLRTPQEEAMNDPYYRRYRAECEEICNFLESLRSGAAAGNRAAAAPGAGFPSTPEEKKVFDECIKNISWQCSECGWPNSGTAACQHCGAPLADEHILENIKNIAHATALMGQAEQQAEQSWRCPSCGAENQGNFCESCGTKKPQNGARCSRCGWQPGEGEKLPKFCPECGNLF